jgi:guanyl-specific ribonuclease Sa
MNRWLRNALLIGVAVAAASGWLSSREIPGDDAAGLPPEAVQTLRLIEAGGPFPYDRDGSVFQNREGLLPQRPRGYYREYTVPTPGSRDRGARRIVSGGQPPEVLYYTDDHYRSFRVLEEPRP